MSHSGPVLVLVHDHIQPPVQAVFHAPVLAHHLVEPLRGEGRAQQIVGGFRAGVLRRFAHPHHFADGLQARPLVLLLEPVDVGRNRCRAGLDTPVIGLDHGPGNGGLARRIIQKEPDIVKQRALIALERQGVVAILFDDLLGDRALAVECIGGHDGTFQGQHPEQPGYGRNLVGLGIGGDLGQYQPLLRAPGADHVQSRLAAGAIERTAQDLAIDGHDPLQMPRKLRHEPLKRIAKLIWIQIAKQPAEGVVAGHAVGQGEKAAQKGLFRLGKQCHVHRP